MAACSGGVDYAQFVKPIITACFGAVNKRDVIDLIKSINKCKEEILNHDDEFKPFFGSFCPLAADFLARNTGCITIGNLNGAVNAAKILMEYLIHQIGKPPIVCGPPTEDNRDISTEIEGAAISEKEKTFVIEDKYFLAGIRALCSAGSLHRPEQLGLVEVMKSAQLPTFVKTTSGDRDSAREARRSRNDPSAIILEQLISPLHDVNTSRMHGRDSMPVAGGDKEDNITLGENNENALYINNIFSSRCGSAFQSLDGGISLIDACLKLQTIQKYTQKYIELLEGKGFGLPTTQPEALAVKPSLTLMVQELYTVWRVFTLPILEPLSPSRLEKLSTIAMAVLLASLHVAMTVGIIAVSNQGASMSKTPPPRDEDIDVIAPSITEKSLDLFNVLLNAVRSSTRAGGHHVQNLQLMGAWLLMTGLHQLILNLSSLSISGQDKKDDKGKSPSKKDGSASGRLNLNKVQQGFGVVCVALSSQGITLLTGLMEDVKVEGLTTANVPQPARLDPLESFSAVERLARIFNSVPLNQVLFYMAIVAYRKSCSLKRTQRALHEGDTFSISDSTTFYEDDFSEASLGDEDDDSVIIGSWFEESAPVADNVAENVQSSSSNPSSAVNSQAKNNRPNSEVTTLVPEKGEPHGFISLSSHIFLLMNNYLVDNDCLYVQQYVRSGLGEMHMIILAAIIRDIDKETAKSDSGSMTSYLGPVLGSLYDEFSYSLYRYTHNIIASEYLSSNLQMTLLTQLGVSPWATEGDWPLQVLPRTLSVLAQILLLRQRKDKDELKCDSDAACVLIWQRVINILVKSINNPSSDSENDDLNVEHAQLLLFLFHSLQLMQKRSVLISVGTALVSVAPAVKSPMRDMQLMHFSRLLLILDYLMKNLYESPQSLIDQVQWNLFKPMSSGSTQRTKDADQSETSSGKLYHSWKALEDNYSKFCSNEDSSIIKPCFYTLSSLETSFCETPKLDGLACGFILATPDSLKYSVFYETIINLLNIGCQLDPSIRGADQKLSYFGHCSLQYAFNIAYRTFLTLPPAVAGLDALVAPDAPMEGPMVLHQIMWGPRTTHKVFVEWIKDGLVRQSLTTQRADSLLKTVSNSVCGMAQDVKLANKIVKSYLQKGFSQEPVFSDLFVLDAVLSRLHVTFDAACQKGEMDSRSENIDVFQALKLSSDQIVLTELFTLVRSISKSIRSSLLQQMNDKLGEENKLDKEMLEAYSSILAISGNSNIFVEPFLPRDAIPAGLEAILDNWNSLSLAEFPTFLGSLKNNTGENLIGDNYISNIVLGHMASLSSQSTFSLNLSLKHVLLTVVSFISDILCWPLGIDKTCPTVRLTFASLALDSVCDHVATSVTSAFKRIDPLWEQHAFKFDAPTPIGDTIYTHILQHVWVLFTVSNKSSSLLGENVINGCGKFLCKLLDSAQGKKSLNSFFEESSHADVLLTPFRWQTTNRDAGDTKPQIPAAVMKFLIKILESHKNDPSDVISGICNNLPLSRWIAGGLKETWFVLLMAASGSRGDTSESWLFVKTLVDHTIQSPKNQEFGQKLLMSFVSLGTSFLEREENGLVSLDHLVRHIYTLLYYVKNGESHVMIFKAFIRWIAKCKELMNKKNKDYALITISHLLPFISDVLVVLKNQVGANKGTFRSGATSPPLESEAPFDESDWMDDIVADDDDSGEDSDEENIGSKLCTFTLTQKEFMNQHWYHCHTCKMVDGVGVCTVCAKVCHRGHDMNYAKYGSFFCDCGAREDASCQALVKRAANTATDGSNTATGSSAFSSSIARSHSCQRPSSPQVKQSDYIGESIQQQRQFLSKSIDSQRERLLAEISCSEIGSTVLELLTNLLPMIRSASLDNSAIGSYHQALNALTEVHSSKQTVTHVNDLMVATLGSQEGAFGNVRLSYTGEQGQAVRRLLSNHMIHRVAMCVLSSPGTKRQHLAVSHEGGKITILQLSSLLKQHDTTKKRLTLARLSSTPIPFTVLSMSANPVNDDFLAVCGVKDCHVLTVSSSGVVGDHLVLHPSLESGNYIIRCIWLPGQQTQLAIITADFIKIYDLSVDSLSPQFFFQMPSGKIKDACFAIAQNDECHLVLMAMSGYIYTQLLCEQSSAKHGPFFVFNVLSFNHPSLKDVNGEVGGGGVSIYYSHTLQLLFFSYVQGQNFIAPLRDIGVEDEIIRWTEVLLKGHAASNNSSNSTTNASANQANGNSRSTSEGSSSSGTPANVKQHSFQQPLCQWCEVPGHPGLLTCMAQGSNWEGNNKGNCPVIIVVKTDAVVVHELKFAPSGSRMSDMVVLRHSWSTSQDVETTLILLCEDGSLKIFNANPRTTDFWLSTLMQKEGIMAAFSPTRKKKTSKLGRSTGNVSFPVDFFEHCAVMNDIEFGGNDLLQIYNVQQLKHRLSSQGMYIASTKPSGFQLHAMNSDPNLVICGIGVAVGSLHISRAPSFVEIFGRTIPLPLTRRRWFDVPLTREESLQADKKLIMTFGPSSDPSGVIIVDSVRLYSKTREEFGWPDETDEFANAGGSSGTGGDASGVKGGISTSRMLATTDRLVSSGLEILDGCFFIDLESNFKWKETVDFATALLNLPLPSSVQYHARSILSSLHSSKASYHNHKDSAQLTQVVEIVLRLNLLSPKQIDCEAYHRLLITARNIAVSRPHNLVKYTEDPRRTDFKAVLENVDDPDKCLKESGKATDEESVPFLTELVKTLWSLHKARPINSILTQICQPGLTHVETSIHSVVEIIHAFTVVSVQYVPCAVKLYTDFLLCPDQAICFSTKQALIKVLKPVSKKKTTYVQSPPRAFSPDVSVDQKDESLLAEAAAVPSPRLPFAPREFIAGDIYTNESGGTSEDAEGAVAASPRLHLPSREAGSFIPGGDIGYPPEAEDFLDVLRAHGNSTVSGASDSLRRSLMGEMLDLHGDDDEAMVELAIALSLHDDSEPSQGNQQLQQNIEGLVGGLEGLRLQGLGSQVLQNLLAASSNHDNSHQAQQMNIDVDQQESGDTDDAEEPQEIERFSDTTVSANGSDDEGEGSTAATDGESNLVASPAEHPGSGGSDSGGSVVESLGGGEHLNASMFISEEQAASNEQEQTEKSSQCEQSEDDAADQNSGLHSLRLALLDSLMLKIPLLKTVGGVRCIPFLQVVLLLTSDMDGQDAKDKAGLNALLNVLISELNFNNWDLSASWERTAEKEVQLVILRLLSVLMSRSKTPRAAGETSLVPFITANKLLKAHMLDNCLDLLKALLDYWKNCGKDVQGGTVIGGNLLKARSAAPAPDMSPFFLKQYVKGHAHDVFVSFPNLITEMLLRLPYQIKKLGDGGQLDPAWSHFLCEYTMTQQTTVVGRQVRKLLLFICGHKDNYRQLRDVHALDYHMKDVRQLCSEGGYNFSSNNNSISLPYDSLIQLMEHLKACLDIATTRTINWQNYCLKDETVLTFMIEISYLLEDGVAPTVLQLIQSAICPISKSNEISKTGSSSSACQSSSSAKRGSSEESDTDVKKEEVNYSALVFQMNKYLDKNILGRFVSTFLLESNATSVRWQAHALLLALYQYSSPEDQEQLLSLFWSLWPRLPTSGRRAGQFVDLLGYFSLKTRQSEKKVLDEIEKAVGVLLAQSQLLAHHPNASLYNSLSSLVEFEGYYLESEPCLVCNNPEISFSSLKLLSVRVSSMNNSPHAKTTITRICGPFRKPILFENQEKYERFERKENMKKSLFNDKQENQCRKCNCNATTVDLRFTTKTQLVKLVSSYMISRLTLRISDLKRTKMVRTLNIYYNNKNVQAIVELKNKPAMWSKAKKVQLSAGQTEVKVDFPLPIVACNLMFEYADFYENLQASTETLQCPGCSAAVPATPGVCASCGENVYQCHKCRAINYDERDPFLCNACGYCKYAKFDYALQCRPCCAVDPIQNENDRQKAIYNIDSLLERADRSYKQLQAYKPSLELFLVLIGEQDLDRSKEEGGHGSTQVNRAIHQLAQKYCGDCKTSFDELSNIIQRIQASRRELVNFDRTQKEGSKRLANSPYVDGSHGVKPSGKCYGCAAAAAEHCITLFRALAINANLRQGLCQQGLIQDLIDYNLRRGTVAAKVEVRHLLCLLTKNDPEATDELNQLIKDRICVALQSQVTSPDLAAAVRNEMALLATSAKKEDSCWQQRLRCVMQIFLMAGGSLASPMVLEHITLPCLRILQGIMSPPIPPPPRKLREKTPVEVPVAPTQSAISCIDIMEMSTGGAKISVDLHKWLLDDPNFCFETWKDRTIHSIKPPTDLSKMPKAEVRERYLMEKYASLWLAKTKWRRHDLKVSEKSWVKTVLFNPSSKMSRQVTSQMLGELCSTTARKKEILDLLTSFLPEVGQAGEGAAEFLSLYKTMITDTPWKQYLALKGVLPVLTNLIMIEIQNLSEIEETTFNIDLSQGYALKVLTELLASFVEVPAIKRTFKGRILGTVLTGYLSLRKFIVQRTKLIDDTQSKFLELLEDMTSGTEDETKDFMAVCIDTLKQYPLEDLRTPVFIFERICSIIYPEENEVGEFYLSLEKDPQQEDFLQGRMVGNPYSSQDSGFGPLMRDLKNKICQDCELVALLEDDSGMELLVCNKIISLDLPVKEVYKKVWLLENSDCEAMRVVYRMRGLLGDATEEFVETLDKKNEDHVDDEKVYRMASVMGQCNGLKVMLEYLQRTVDLCYAKPLLSVLLKLFHLCAKLASNREKLTEPPLGAVGVLLHTLKQCLAAEPEVVAGPAGGTSLTEQILSILEAILVEAATERSAVQYGELIEACGLQDIHLLLNYVATSSRTNFHVRERLMRVLPFLVFNNKEKMELLIGHFKPVLDFSRFDSSQTPEDQAKLEAFCVFCTGIEKNQIGKQLQEMIIRANIVKDALAHIEDNIPQTKKFFIGEFFDDDWKEFTTKPSLKYVLRILTGLATKDLRTQQAVAKSCIPSIHRLEQISSDEHIGSLAENLLEALKDDPSIVQQIKETRRKTRQEKKQLAMKTRKKELEKLGLTANEKEQITSESSFLKEIDELTEENGLVCAICLEGYRCQPQKVLAIYTFSKRCALDEFENKTPKTLGHSTVSHFNVVHVDCHVAAVRVTHPRDEWERAALHNANTKANGLLPVWGPQVPESGFAACLARHNTYLQECTGHRDINYMSTLHDLKLLLQRFSHEKSFSGDSGGGGPQSNMNLIPYILHMALYVINTTRAVGLELSKVESFFAKEKDTWIDSSFDVEGPYFIGALSLAVVSYEKWREYRIQFLQKCLITNHIRAMCSKPPASGKFTDKSVQSWKTYKSAAIFWALIDGVYNLMFKKVSTEGIYTANLAEYIRNHDQALIEAASKLLSTYQNDLITTVSFTEFIDVVDLLQEISDPEKFLSDLLQSLS